MTKISRWMLCLALASVWGGSAPLAAQSPETPATAAQSPSEDSALIEPYTGPPIYLDEGEKPPTAQIVETSLQSDKYANGKLRMERSVTRFSDDTLESNGLYREFFENGQLFVEGEYEKNKMTGKWTYYHRNGEVAKTVTYVAGKPDGVVETRDESGKLLSRQEYKEGVRGGEWTRYLIGKSPKTADEQSGQTDTEQGDAEKTDAEPVQVREEHYLEGKPDGVWRSWSPSGRPLQQASFKAGVRDGAMIEWDAAGEKRIEANFVAGKRQGLTRVWTTDGKVIEQHYEDDKVVRQEGPK